MGTITVSLCRLESGHRLQGALRKRTRASVLVVRPREEVTLLSTTGGMPRKKPNAARLREMEERNQRLEQENSELRERDKAATRGTVDSRVNLARRGQAAKGFRDWSCVCGRMVFGSRNWCPFCSSHRDLGHPFPDGKRITRQHRTTDAPPTIPRPPPPPPSYSVRHPLRPPPSTHLGHAVPAGCRGYEGGKGGKGWKSGWGGGVGGRGAEAGQGEPGQEGKGRGLDDGKGGAAGHGKGVGREQGSRRAMGWGATPGIDGNPGSGLDVPQVYDIGADEAAQLAAEESPTDAEAVDPGEYTVREAARRQQPKKLHFAILQQKRKRDTISKQATRKMEDIERLDDQLQALQAQRFEMVDELAALQASHLAILERIEELTKEEAEDAERQRREACDGAARPPASQVGDGRVATSGLPEGVDVDGARSFIREAVAAHHSGQPLPSHQQDLVVQALGCLDALLAEAQNNQVQQKNDTQQTTTSATGDGDPESHSAQLNAPSHSPPAIVDAAHTSDTAVAPLASFSHEAPPVYVPPTSLGRVRDLFPTEGPVSGDMWVDGAGVGAGDKRKSPSEPEPLMAICDVPRTSDSEQVAGGTVAAVEATENDASSTAASSKQRRPAPSAEDEPAGIARKDLLRQLRARAGAAPN